MKNKEKTGSSFIRWFFYLLFPPYAIFVLVFRSKKKWYIRFPIALLIIFILILSADQTINPYRVETYQVEKTIDTFISKPGNESFGELVSVERQGAFPWKKKTEVVYKVLTKNGLYDFVLNNSKENEYKVDAIYEPYPSQSWLLNENLDLPSYPTAMVYFYENQDKLGTVKSGSEKDGQSIIKTDKGTFKYKFSKNKVVSVTNGSGKEVLKQKNQYILPESVHKYFEKHKKEIGTIKDVFDYDMDTEKESYHLKSDKGRYRVDIYPDGNIKLLEAVISKSE